jgi:hypothetical protein
MTAQERFDEVLVGGVWPFLKARGFKRTRGTFHRPVGRNWQVVNLQKSAYSDRSRVRFTTNLGVAVDRLRGGALDWREGTRPIEPRCHFRQRIGSLLQGGDTWWEVTPETDVAMLTDVVCEVIERYGFPWLDARSTDESLTALVADPERLRAETYGHHLQRLEQLMGQLGREDLRASVAEVRRSRDG